MSSALDRSSAPKDGRLRAALEFVAEVHGQEVLNLQEENKHLRNQVTQLRDHLKQVQARSICAKIDEPKMQSVAQSVAEDVAGWIDAGGVEGWQQGAQELEPEPAHTSPWQEKAPSPRPPEPKPPSPAAEPPVQEKRSSIASSSRKKSAIRSSSATARGSGRTSRNSQWRSSVQAVSFSPQPDVKVVPELDRSSDNNSTVSDGDKVQPGSEVAEQRHSINGDLTVQQRHTVHDEPPVEEMGSLDSGGGVRTMRSRKRRSIQQLLTGPEGEEARMMAQKTMDFAEKQQLPMSTALGVGRGTRKQGKSGRNPPIHRTGLAYWVHRLVSNTAFDVLCAVMILLNSLLIALSTDHQTTGADETELMKALGYFFSVFFLIELGLRVIVHGRRFISWNHEGWFWNWFDISLVAFSVFDIIMSWIGSSGPGSQSLKTIKMLRILRLFRVFRFLKDLSLLALMVIDSLKSLGNALLMLALIMFVFGILFTTETSNYLNNGETNPQSKEAVDLERYFGSLVKTWYSLLQAMLGGISWGVLTDSFVDTKRYLSVIIFLLYVFFTMLAVLNIITGVFVDNALETSRTQRDYLVQKEMELKEKYVREMQKLFTQMDEDNSGTVSLEEVKEYFEDPQVKSYFTALGLDPQDSERLFTLLDDDGSGDVGVTEFIDGCLRLKGQARSIDIYALLVQSSRMENKLKEVLEVLPRAYRRSQMHGDDSNEVMICESTI